MTDYAYADRFKEVYPAIARRILAATGTTRGRCLDIGCGAGQQGLALAEISDLELWLLDSSPDGLRLAEERIAAGGLGGRARTFLADAAALPFPDDQFDLAVSRGSIDFWDRPERGLREALRVLKPGCWAWIGGGFGSVEQRMEINRSLGERAGISPGTLRNPAWLRSVGHYRRAAEDSGIRPLEFIDDDAGIWIVFKKPGRGAGGTA
jgi:SAM-dependent methyltransferase